MKNLIYIAFWHYMNYEIRKLILLTVLHSILNFS
jgi:hypothetical protein